MDSVRGYNYNSRQRERIHESSVGGCHRRNARGDDLESDLDGGDTDGDSEQSLSFRPGPSNSDLQYGRVRDNLNAVCFMEYPYEQCEGGYFTENDEWSIENDDISNSSHNSNYIHIFGPRNHKDQYVIERKSYNNSGNQVQSDYNDEIGEKEEDLIGRSQWHLNAIDFNQIQRPQSIDFDQVEDQFNEDTHFHHNEVDHVPMREISFHQQNMNFEYSQHEIQSLDNENFVHNHDAFHRYDNEFQCRDENDVDSVEGNFSQQLETNRDHRNTIILPAKRVFQSSDSRNVIQRIEAVVGALFMCLDKKEEPILRGYVNPEPCDDNSNNAIEIPDTQSKGDPKFYRSFSNIAQSRSFTSICLIMSFIHQLLLTNRTTTTREVFYVFVTHFRNQRECDSAILDVAKMLGVSRRSLGLFASPKGWFCGCIEMTRKGTLPSGTDVSDFVDGTALFSIQGLPITKEWTERDDNGCTSDGVEVKVFSKGAKVILVIEKEGVYNRLSEERIFDRYPCILVTGKGFPDLATRALVSTLHRELGLPVAGLCDCNPFGISVLALYHSAGDRMGVDGRRRYTVPIQWIGLRPSEVARLKSELPETVFQKITDIDKKRIASLLDLEDPYLTEEDGDEVRGMKDTGYKVELEALYWLGPDYMSSWVVQMLKDEYGDE